MMQDEKMNLISSTTKLEGKIHFNHYTRFEGTLNGTLVGEKGSELVLGEKSLIEGDIIGDTVIIDGFVRGKIQAATKVVITPTGRVIGKIDSPSLAVHFGAYFDGSCEMNKKESPKASL